eukprot:TRINITY_DN2094_c0_g1_i1.p1 TRINITY_DN2094_c0_g1~~TRINITY_DN2094_c0_g1_i1.p1  ORF type:complete len:1830 (-),score=225.66 TRINITY_DN2094_c0_g1_i1:253-5616(-)
MSTMLVLFSVIAISVTHALDFDAHVAHDMHAEKIFFHSETIDTRLSSHGSKFATATDLRASLSSEAGISDAPHSERGHFILQFVEPSATSDFPAKIERFFGTAGRYIPNNAWVVFSTPDEVARFRDEHAADVIWVGTMRAHHKLTKPFLQSVLAAEQRALQVKAETQEEDVENEPSPVSRQRVVFIELTPPADSGRGFADTVAKRLLAGASAVKRLQAVTDARLAAVFHPATDETTYAATIRWLMAQPEVYFVQPKNEIQFFNDISSVVIQGNSASQRPIWDNGILGNGEIIGIADSGLDYYGCQFRDSKQDIAYYPSSNANHRKVLSLRKFHIDSTYTSCYDDSVTSGLSDDDTDDVASGHGTHVSSCATGFEECNATSTTNITGCKISYTGMAPFAKIFFHDLAPAASSSTTAPAPMAQCDLNQDFLTPSKNLNVHIMSNSWGAGCGDAACLKTGKSYDYLAQQVDEFMWKNTDYLVLFAAGNSGSSGSRTVAEPANAKNVLAVGAAEQGLSKIAFFSSYGPTPDGRIKPDIIAPGYQVTAQKSQGNANKQACSFTQKSGTSMATPTTAGAAALLREYLRRGFYVDGKENSTVGISAPEGMVLKTLLMLSGDLLAVSADAEPSGVAQTRIPTFRQGFGRVDLGNVMFATRRIWFNRQWQAATFQQDIAFGDSPHKYCIRTRADTKSVKIMLYWPDYPPDAAAATGALVTNLDLLVYSDATTFHGNQDAGSSQWDNVNNAEVVVLPSTTGGNFTIYVSLRKALTYTSPSRQPYVLAISGDFDGPSSQYCTGACPPYGASSCFGAGTCNSGSCSCGTGYSGLDCSMLSFNTSNTTACSSSCNGKGCKANGASTCTCLSDALNGFYDPATSCLNCTSGYAKDTSNNCLLDQSCSSHGSYNATAKACQCQTFNGDVGSWSGRSCEKCADGWFGSSCKCVQTDTSVCGGHGDCTAAGCSCFNDNTRGHWTGVNVSRCNLCMSGWFGDACLYSTNCSGHGTFNSLTQACECSLGWAGTICNTCATGWFGKNCNCKGSTCGGHGTCTDNGCSCYANPTSGYWNGSNTCDICAAGYFGTGCLCASANCNGHGICTAQGCVCNDTDDTGHWLATANSSLCTTCKTGWTGSACLCSTAGGVTCSGHGQCGDKGCVCYRDMTNGFWMSTTTSPNNCLVCLSTSEKTYEGPNAVNDTYCRCPRFKFTGMCSGHGTCEIAGCNCAAVTSSALAFSGKWKRDSANETCSACQAGWYGPGCACSSVDCNGHGSCTKDGCLCNSTFATGFFKTNSSIGAIDCLSCDSGWSAYPYCRCWQECSAKSGSRGSCTESGCKCYNDDTLGHFVGTAKNGIDGDYSGDCNLCSPGYSGNEGKCLCRQGTCSTLVFNNCSSVAGQTCPIDTTLKFDDSTTVRIISTTDEIFDSDTATGVRFSSMPTSLTTHPSKSVPNSYKYLDKTAIEIIVTVDTSSNTSRHGMHSSSKFSRLTDDTNLANPKVTLLSSFIVAIPYPTEPTVKDSLKSGGTDAAKQALKINYNKNHPEMWILDGKGWVLARTTCPTAQQLAASEEFDQSLKVIKTRLCWIRSDTPIAIFVKLQDSYPFYVWIILGVVAFVLVLSLVTVICCCRRRLKRAEQAKTAKEKVIAYLTNQKKGKARLRERLNLKPDEVFTPKMAAERFLKRSEKARKRLQRQQTAVPGIKANPTEASEAVGKLATTKSIDKVWEFKDHEMELVEAARKVRGLFQQDPFSREWGLKPNALPDIQQQLLQLQQENDKLKRLLGNSGATNGSAKNENVVYSKKK